MLEPFKPVDRDTPYLLPPSLQDWLPQEHLARFVVEIVDRLDLSELERAYGGRGKTPYHPAVMVALLFYGYATGVFSSRRLEQATYDSVAFRYITADTHPDHDTIAHFRKRFLEPLRGLFVQVLVIAQAMGVLKIGTVSLDGTKVKANASKHKAMSWGNPMTRSRAWWTSSTRRWTQRIAPASPTGSRRNALAAALRLGARSACATTASTSSSSPGSRAARQSGSRLKVVWLSGQYQRAICVPRGVLRA